MPLELSVSSANRPLKTGAMSAFPYSENLRAKYVFKTRFGEEVDMTVRDGAILWVPREGCLTALPPNDFRVRNEPRAIDCTFIPKDEEQATLIPKSAELLLAGRSHRFDAPTGWGKSALFDEQVLLFSGILKKVQDVRVGDLLMGPDSTPRRVLALGSGRMQAYELRTPRGEVLRFNEEHILTLKRTSFFQKDGGRKSGLWKGGELVDIRICDYLQKSKTFKHQYKLWKPDVVHFPYERKLPICPYVLGLLLGDGCLLRSIVGFTSNDPILVDYLATEVGRFDCKVTSDNINKPSEYFVVGGAAGENKFLDTLRSLGVHGNTAEHKRVPLDYKTSSVEERLQLIAGLIDSDGHHNNKTFDWISKSEQLADDMCYLCWSVGLAAVKAPCKKECVNNGVWGEYYRVCISGTTSRVPCKLLRKVCGQRKQKKSVTMQSFTVTDIGDQDYYGFVLDEDHRYLTGNFFVTHNTVAGAMVAQMLGQRTMIVVTKEDLMEQWYDTFVRVLKFDPKHIGKVQQDTCDWKGKQFVIGMVHSLVIPDRYPLEMYRYFGLLELDEVHLMAADTFQKVLHKFPAYYRLGFSATQDRTDGKSRILDAHIGPVLVKGTIVPMTPTIAVKYTSWKIPIVNWKEDGVYVQKKMPHAPGRMMGVVKVMAADPVRNFEIVNFVLQAYKKGRVVLILSDLIDDHLKHLFHLLCNAGVPGEQIGYYIGGMKKGDLECTKKARIVLGTYAMCSTGTNVPVWDTLVMATPRANVKQSLGRVLRSMIGKKKPAILDLVDADPLLEAFFGSRMKQYRSIGAHIVRL